MVGAADEVPAMVAGVALQDCAAAGGRAGASTPGRHACDTPPAARCCIKEDAYICE